MHMMAVKTVGAPGEGRAPHFEFGATYIKVPAEHSFLIWEQSAQCEIKALHLNQLQVGA